MNLTPKCKYCGRVASWFRWLHPECRSRHTTGLSRIRKRAFDAATKGFPNCDLKKELEEVAKASFVKDDELREALIGAWDQAVDFCVTDKVMTKDEETSLTAFADSLSLPETDRNRHGALAHIVQNLTLRDISEGTVPHRVFANDMVPFNLQKQESIVWLFPAAKYYEEKTRREFVGRSQGISVRVAKGVYLRSGTFRGRPIETTRMEHVDTGTMGITNKSIYFAGSRKAVRVAFSRIVAFHPYIDGLGIHQDGRARPQTFVTGDGCFIYNLVRGLAEMSLQPSEPSPSGQKYLEVAGK
jgi:hypothetical protein